MLLLTEKTKQDFLSPRWCQKLLDAGIDMSDATYYIIHKQDSKTGEDKYYITPTPENEAKIGDPIPTYTLSELLYKIPEWIYKTDDVGDFRGSGKLSFLKDAPFYMFYFKDMPLEDHPRFVDPFLETQQLDSEYPIYSAAMLLLWCKKNGYDQDINITGK